MDKSTDSSSDSDSSSSTSWVFVEDTTTITSPKTANMFHLDCSREPIQELTEQDLLSAGSDFESDTDGISVISESEIPIDDPSVNIQACANNNSVEDNTDLSEHDGNNTVYNEVIETTTNEVLLVKQQPEKLTKINTLHMLGIGFVLTAIFLACYSRITTKVNKENENFNNGDVPLYDKIDDVTSYNKIDLTSCDVPIKTYDTNTELNKDLEEIVDITMTCAFQHKPKNDFLDKQIKKCVKKEYHTKKLGNLKYRNNIYSITLEESIKFHKKIESKFKNVNDNNNKPKCTSDDDTICNTNEKKIYKKNKLDEFGNNKDKVVIKLKLPKKKPNLQESFKKDHHKNNENYERLSKYEIPITKPNYKYQKDIKKNVYKNKKEIYDYKDKKFEFKDYHNKYQKNVNKIKEVANKYAKNRDSKYKDKMTQQKRNNTTGGEWYSNLHKARNQLRKQEHVSDWVFDRAHLRNKKRNKAQWYFKWMNVREQLRYKQSYKPYSS